MATKVSLPGARGSRGLPGSLAQAPEDPVLDDTESRELTPSCSLMTQKKVKGEEPRGVSGHEAPVKTSAGPGWGL